MIRLIGARWKCGNVWSRSVLIEALTFYDQLTGCWCISYDCTGLFNKLLESVSAMDIGAAFLYGEMAALVPIARR